MFKNSIEKTRQVLEYLETFELDKVLPTATARDRSPFSLDGDLVVAHPANISAAIWPGLPPDLSAAASSRVSGTLRALGGARRRDLHGYAFDRSQA